MRVSAYVVAKGGQPRQVHTVSILQLVEYSVTANHYKVMGLSVNFEGSYVGICHNHSIVTPKLSLFCLNVAKSTAHRQSAREYSVRPQYDLTLHSAHRLLDIDD